MARNGAASERSCATCSPGWPQPPTSSSSADQAVRVLGVDPARVEIVHNGVDPQFSPGPTAAVDPPYLLYVGGWGPSKGYAEAMAVAGALAEAGFPHRLRMAGPHDAW